MTEERSDKPDMRERLAREGAELVGSVSLLAAVLGVLAAFLGWRAGTAYLLSFGLHPGWESTDVIGLIVTAWPEVLVILLLIAFCVLGRMAVGRLAGSTSARSLFYLFIVLSITFLILLGVAILTFVVRFGLYTYAAFGGLLFANWWTLALFGEHLFANDAAVGVDSVPRRVRTVLSVVFSSRTAILLFTVALGALYVMNLAGVRGSRFARRDQTEASHLPIVTVIANTPLGIPGEQTAGVGPLGGQLYQYSDLRLIVRQEDHIFVFRLAEAEPDTGALARGTDQELIVDVVAMRSGTCPHVVRICERRLGGVAVDVR